MLDNVNTKFLVALTSGSADIFDLPYLRIIKHVEIESNHFTTLNCMVKMKTRRGFKKKNVYSV